MENENNDTPNVEGQTTEQQKTTQPFAIFPDATSFKARVDREARQIQEKFAKEMGFDSAETMRTVLQAQQQGQKKKEDQLVQPNEADRLRLALQVAGDLNLHPVLISRLQGTTIEELTADAQRLQALFQPNQSNQSKQGIPNAPAGKTTPVTFTKDQLKDAAFVRANQAAIYQAAREGRIQ
jgi:hypothetical protein